MGLLVSPSLQCKTSPAGRWGQEGARDRRGGQLGRSSSAVRGGTKSPGWGWALPEPLIL